MTPQVRLAAIATAIEATAGASTTTNASRAGYWKRIALAAEAMAGETFAGSDTSSGWASRAAQAIEAVVGETDGSIENASDAGYMKRIADAMEASTGATSGPWSQRVLTALATWEPVQEEFDPATLFVGGHLGAWYDFNDLSTVFEDYWGTIPATVGNVVGRVVAKAGTFTPLLQSIGTAMPILRLHAPTGKYYLEFDATDDRLDTTTTVSYTNQTQTTLAAYRTISPANQAAFGNYGGSSSSGSFGVTSGSVAQANFAGFSRGSANATAATALSSHLGAQNIVIGTQSAQATDFLDLRINGAVAASAATDQGSGNFAARTLFIGRLATGGLNAGCFGLFTINRVLTAGELLDLETMLAARCGATLA
jgi:hypothetical protein